METSAPRNTSGVEFIQQSPEGAGKEPLLSVEIFCAPPWGDTPPRSWVHDPQDFFLDDMIVLSRGDH